MKCPEFIYSTFKSTRSVFNHLPVSKINFRYPFLSKSRNQVGVLFSSPTDLQEIKKQPF